MNSPSDYLHPISSITSVNTLHSSSTASQNKGNRVGKPQCLPRKHEYPYTSNYTSTPSSLTSVSLSSQNKVTHNSNHPLINDDYSSTKSSQRKDLFRAYLDVRQHSTPFEESQANYLKKTSDNIPGQISNESSNEYFSGGQKGIHSTNPTFKMIPRPSREQPNNRLPSSSWFSCDTSTLEEIDLKKNDVRSSLGKGNESDKLSAFQFARLSESLSSSEPDKENMPQMLKDNGSTTFDNIFGGRYDESNVEKVTINKTHNNHPAYQPRRVNPTYEDISIENDGSKGLYRMTQSPARCSMWMQENESSRRVLSNYQEDNHIVESEKEDMKDSKHIIEIDRKEMSRQSSRMEESRRAPQKSSRNVLLNNIEDSNCTIKKVPHKNVLVAKESKPESVYQSTSIDPFDTKRWFKNSVSVDDIPQSPVNESIHFGMDRMGRQGRVVPSSDPLSVTRTEEPCNTSGAHYNYTEEQEDQNDLDVTFSSLNNTVKERMQNIKRLPNSNRGLERSECSWFRDKHIYNRDGKTNFKPECRYNFSCVNKNEESNG